MEFSKNLSIILNALLALLTVLIGTLLVINKLILEGIGACVIGILVVIWFNIWRARNFSLITSYSTTALSDGPLPHADDESNETLPLNSPVIDPQNYFPQINLESLKIWGDKWGKKYDHLSQILLYDAPLGDPELQNQCYKYILYFEFEQNQGGELNKAKFEEMRWKIEAYPISECKNDIYKIDPSEIDLLFEWNIVTEKPKAIDKNNYFIVFRRKLMGII